MILTYTQCLRDRLVAVQAVLPTAGRPVLRQGSLRRSALLSHRTCRHHCNFNGIHRPESLGAEHRRSPSAPAPLRPSSSNSQIPSARPQPTQHSIKAKPAITPKHRNLGKCSFCKLQTSATPRPFPLLPLFTLPSLPHFFHTSLFPNLAWLGAHGLPSCTPSLLSFTSHAC